MLALALTLAAVAAPKPKPPAAPLPLPIGLSQGLVCDTPATDVRWSVDDEARLRLVQSNSIPAFPVLDYCPFGIGGLYCGAYKSCPSGVWGVGGEECVPEGSGIVLDPNR